MATGSSHTTHLPAPTPDTGQLHFDSEAAFHAWRATIEHRTGVLWRLQPSRTANADVAEKLPVQQSNANDAIDIDNHMDETLQQRPTKRLKVDLESHLETLRHAIVDLYTTIDALTPQQVTAPRSLATIAEMTATLRTLKCQLESLGGPPTRAPAPGPSLPTC